MFDDSNQEDKFGPVKAQFADLRHSPWNKQVIHTVL